MTYKAGVLKPNQITDQKDVVSKPAEEPPETSQAGRNPDQRDGHQREGGHQEEVPLPDQKGCSLCNMAAVFSSW